MRSSGADSYLSFTVTIIRFYKAGVSVSTFYKTAYPGLLTSLKCFFRLSQGRTHDYRAVADHTCNF